MKPKYLILLLAAAGFCQPVSAAPLAVTDSPNPADMVVFDGKNVTPLCLEAGADRAVQRAANDLADDFARVTGVKPVIENQASPDHKLQILVGTLGQSKLIDQLSAQGKLDTAGITGQWESYILQIVKSPLPNIDAALVIAGSDRRGTIFGIYQLSEIIGVSPWYWWADVPVAKKKLVALRGDALKQGPPAVKYRGIFLNDEDWGLFPWAAMTFDPQTRNIGPKTYAKIFELLLRLRSNYLWPAMHPGTAAFNSFPEDAKLAGDYGIVMGSSHCEQMLRNNVTEYNERTNGPYNFVTNPERVLQYWEERVRSNANYESTWTLGMRGIHDSGMPGGGTDREKSLRLQTIISEQRKMLARDVNTNVTAIPQIFCPYKEVLPLYRMMTNMPEDVTLVWPDDNFGYIRQFSDSRERARSGGAGVYYHVSYWGVPRDYLWLCSTPPALIAEEMCKAYDYGATKVWILNVGDIKPAELDTEFFLDLAWSPHSWTGTNTYELLQRQVARDFPNSTSAEITSIMAEYYRLNFQRKPEHIGYPRLLFSAGESAQRLAQWQKLTARVDAVKKLLPAEFQDAFFELVEYPEKSAEWENIRFLAPGKSEAAQMEIDRLTDAYNTSLANGKWRGMMSNNPERLRSYKVPTNAPPPSVADVSQRLAILAAHASEFIAGKDAHWQKISGLGYSGEAVSIFPTTVAIRNTPEKIMAESPCLKFSVTLQLAGDWKFNVRALPTFSVDTGRPQRYAIALDDEAPRIISLPISQSDGDRTWQMNVLRNAALASSVHTVAAPGPHVLKLWMVDPGIVLDTIEADPPGATPLPGYLWPTEMVSK
jgi:hypothetical protein